MAWTQSFRQSGALDTLQPKLAKSRMPVGSASERPAVFAVRLFDREIIDAREAHAHQPVVVVFPIFVSVRTVPVPRIVVPFVRETHSNPIPRKSPELLN